MIFALIPAYNEAERIAPVVKQTGEYLPVIVVDDGSSDRTAEIAAANGATVLRQSSNQGKGAALIAGFRRALGQGCRAVITLDADGQHDPHEIPQFLQAYRRAPADLIIGARQFEQMPPIRRLANTLGQKAFSWAVGRPIHDNQSGYRLVGRRLLEAMLVSQESGFQFEVEMIVTCVEHGFDLTWLPIRTIYAGESSHIRPLRHTLDFSFMVWKTWLRMRKIKK